MRKIIIVEFIFFIFIIMSGCKVKQGKSEEERCKDKGASWYWDKWNEGCTEKVMTGPDSCKWKPGGYVWDVNQSQCKEIDYFMFILPANYSSERSSVFAVLEDGDDIDENNSKVELNSSGDCVKVHKSHLSKVRVFIKGKVASLPICAGGNQIITSVCPLGVYELVSGSIKLNKTIPTAERTDCTILEPSQ